MNETFTLKDGRQVVIRSTQSSDYEAVQIYLQQLATETIFTNQYVGQLPKTPEEFEQSLKGCFTFTVSDGEKVIGLFSLFPYKPTHKWLKYTASFGVHMLQNYTHQGLGHKMMDILEAVARDQKLHRIEGEVRHTNIAGIVLYLKHGFVIEGCKKDIALINGQWHHNYQIAKILD